jgi:hypothetical protein
MAFAGDEYQTLPPIVNVNGPPAHGRIHVAGRMVPKRTLCNSWGARLGEGKRPRSGEFPLSEARRASLGIRAAEP